VDADTCITCFCCQEICPEKAITLQWKIEDSPQPRRSALWERERFEGGFVQEFRISQCQTSYCVCIR
jgi:formate hydrogenlyase subunit 6/NADH:ubiquinone oxidoreductase subunit I